jgi:hypothetical protein
MNSLKQLAAIYGEDDDDDEEDFTSSLSTQIDKRGMKRSREDEQDEADVLGSSEGEKSRWNFDDKYFRIFIHKISYHFHTKEICGYSFIRLKSERYYLKTSLLAYNN